LHVSKPQSGASPKGIDVAIASATAFLYAACVLLTSARSLAVRLESDVETIIRYAVRSS
jgi:hypothetical protein